MAANLFALTMNKLFNRHSFIVQLVTGFVALILLTTLMAGVPAYLLTRVQLEKQAWLNVENARHSTLSLLRAEADRLADQTTLLAERPTLQRLVREQNLAELPGYLEEFRAQSGLDWLLFCNADGAVAGQAELACDTAVSPTYALIANQPALIVSQPVADNLSGAPLGTAVAGITLNDAFWQTLAASTGSRQNLHLAQAVQTITPEPQEITRADGRRYFADFLPLPSASQPPLFYLEIALPVDDLIATENQARLILAASTLLVAVMGTAVGYWVVRRLVSPLQSLTEAADRISQGDLLAPIPSLSDPAEVQTLAAALQQSQASMLRALEESSQARNWLNTLIQSIVEGVITFDSAGTVTFFSQGAEALLGWARADAVGQPINAILPIAEEEAATFLDYAPPPGQKRILRVRTQGGQTTLLAITGAHMVPPDSYRVQVALVLRDVTPEEAVRHLRSYFLANISHEFRTPLSTLNASMELLLDETEALTAQEMRELIKPSYLSLISLQTLVDNLLESSRIEAGYFGVQKRPLPLNTLLTDALNIVRPMLERRRQTFSLTEPARPLTLHGDAVRLTQVVVNLLGNASKYSPLGSAIELRISQQGDGLRVAVLDEGPGIPPAELSNVFRRFYRLEAQDREQYGIGLGLFVVKTIIAAHDGRVGAENRPEGGAVFWFELPVV
ncbi:MAG: HAMP domain-containing protein [Chloroflexi bacterium]|nr:HAMP domain-containing protein [Chloroflexota bacterium]MBP7044001.1 HAMP domain-containing protein [Chloroflexota bacterium]